MLSGPTALVVSIDDNDWYTSSSVTSNSAGTCADETGGGSGWKWSVRLVKKSLILFERDFVSLEPSRNWWYHSWCVLASQAFYLFPPFSGVCVFYISNSFMVIMLFSGFYFALYFISPEFVSAWIFAMLDKWGRLLIHLLILFVIHGRSVGCFLTVLCGRTSL